MTESVFIALLILILIVNISLFFSLKALKKINGKLMDDSILFKRESDKIEKVLKEDLSAHRKESSNNARSLREEVTKYIQEYNKTILNSFDGLAVGQFEQLKSFEQKIETMSKENLKSQETLRDKVEFQLTSIQDKNEKQLDKMRSTVEEKLQTTLEKRLSSSFKQVDEQLKEVHQGLGEMKELATGVGDLKKVLTNVKTRGTWGEFQLGNILEEVLTPDQYRKNFSLKKSNSTSVTVEYAVKLPGQGLDKKEAVYLPIDSKFPQEDYQKLVDAQEKSDSVLVAAATTKLTSTVKQEARKIRDKYISPPETTDFAIMFFPTESLFAEILKRAGLAELLQREYRVIITGPTNFAALLNSLSVGFRTLAIQKRSSDVWKLLGTIKKQFSDFSSLLDRVQNKLDKASEDMKKASDKSKVIEKGLIRVEELPDSESSKLLASQ